MSVNQLKKFFKFRPAMIGNECKVNGGSIEFYYALHSIPCIGFICRYQGKSIYFSGDTFYYPEKMKETYVDVGKMTQKRYEYLTDFNIKFNHDLILHEMGVPPIHTPQTILAALPQEVKDKIIIVHSSKNNINPTSGLHAAKEGIENTYILYDSDF
jgi:phosphoribosyl 1,2-cyclic phosphodiesterase